MSYSELTRYHQLHNIHRRVIWEQLLYYMGWRWRLSSKWGRRYQKSIRNGINGISPVLNFKSPVFMRSSGFEHRVLRQNSETCFRSLFYWNFNIFHVFIYTNPSHKKMPKRCSPDPITCSPMHKDMGWNSAKKASKNLHSWQFEVMLRATVV